MPTRREMKEIERIVEEELDDSEMAKKLKRRLREKLGSESRADAAPADEGAEDLWENLPV